MPPPSPFRQLEAMSLLGRYQWQDHGLEDTMAEALRLAAEATAADTAAVLERWPEAGFTVQATYSRIPTLQPPADTALHDIAARTLASPARRLVTAGPGSGEPGTHIGAACAAAIGSPDAPYGTIVVCSDTPDVFGDQAAACLEGLAAMLGLAIRRARQTAELERERDERFRLASLVEGSEDAIVSATLDGTIISWNPGARRLYGYAAHEIVGEDVSILVPAERDADRRHLLARVRAGERIPAFDAEHRRKDGSRVTVSLSLSPIRDQHGQILAFAGIAHDVTKTRQLESELRQSAKMEAVGRLAGGLAHDFNNMLTVIDGYSELLLMKLPAERAERPLVEEIHRAGERAAELARQLMVFSRKSMVEPRVLDLSDVVRSDVDMLRRVIGEDITIDTVLADGLDHVMADRAQLAQLLVNLVLNARDAMPDGGRITIATASAEDESDGGSNPAAASGPYVVLSVADTGHGMDEATLGRIFEPFFTSKGSGRGTGLGLAMLQSFVKQSGGHVAVASEPGAGTTFRIYLPTVALPVAAGPGEAMSEGPRGSGTILVVEDDDAVRVYTEAVLRAAGYEVLSAANGADALTLARNVSGHVDVLMSDVVMPVLGGHALAEQFAGVHPRTRVLFTSGYTREAVSRRGFVIPPEQFLQKPYSPAALCRKIRRVLAGEDAPEPGSIR